MQIKIDRDSVCMGDDTESHEWVLDVDPQRKLGSLVAQALREYRLASVGGEVSWLVEVRLGRYERDEHGGVRSPTTHELALLHVPYPSGEPTVIALNRHFLAMTVAEMVQRAPRGEMKLNFHYLSDGIRRPTDEFIALYG